MTRCFVGFELTEESREYLRSRVEPVHAALRERGRWPMRLVRPENWHLTLLFFPGLSGEERARVWPEIEAAARDGVWRSLDFAWKGLSLWPDANRPSLIALEADGYPDTRSWPIARLLDQPPFSKAEVGHYRDFRPHITLIRFDPRWRKTIGAVWAEVTDGLPPIDPAAIRFDGVSFLLSTLTKDAPVYPRERTATIR